MIGVGGRPEQHLMLGAVHKVLSGLGREMVAGFVDGRATLEAALEIGTDYVQG